MIPAIYYNILTTSLIAFLSLAIFLRSLRQAKNREVLFFGIFWFFSSAAYFLTLYLDLAYLHYQDAYFQAYRTMAILTHLTVPLMGLGLFLFIFGPYLKTKLRMTVGLIIYSIGPIYFFYCVFFQDWAEVLISRWGIDYRPPVLAIVPFIILVTCFLVLLLIQSLAYLK